MPNTSTETPNASHRGWPPRSATSVMAWKYSLAKHATIAWNRRPYGGISERYVRKKGLLPATLRPSSRVDLVVNLGVEEVLLQLTEMVAKLHRGGNTVVISTRWCQAWLRKLLRSRSEEHTEPGARESRSMGAAGLLLSAALNERKPVGQVIPSFHFSTPPSLPQR